MKATAAPAEEGEGFATPQRPAPQRLPAEWPTAGAATPAPEPTPGASGPSCEEALVSAAALLSDWKREAKVDNLKALKKAREAAKVLERVTNWEDEAAPSRSPGTLRRGSALGAVYAAAAVTLDSLSGNVLDPKHADYWRRARARAALALALAPDHAHVLLTAARLCLSDDPPHLLAAEGFLKRCEAAADAAPALLSALPEYDCTREAKALLETTALDTALHKLISGYDKLGFSPKAEPARLLELPALQVLSGVGVKLAGEGHELYGTSPKKLADLPHVSAAAVTAQCRARALCAALQQPEWASVSDVKARETDADVASSGSDAQPHLVLATWNLRASLPMHDVPNCLAAKVEAVFQLLSSDARFALLVLQECPGSGLGAAGAGALEAALKARLPREWHFGEVACGAENAAFLFDSTRLAQLAPPQEYPNEDWPRAPNGARRAPVLGLFRALPPAPDAIVAVLSVHLKSAQHAPPSADAPASAAAPAASGGNGSSVVAQEQLRVLGTSVLTWAEARAAAAAPAAQLRPVLALGDFNLCGPHDTAECEANYAGDAWCALLDAGFQPLLKPGSMTNVGRPVSAEDRSYDHILARGTAGGGSSGAAVHLPLAAELREATALLDAIRALAARTTMATALAVDTERFCVEQLKKRVYAAWSDHWPVVAHLRFAQTD